jgi:hypothetical protein
MDNKDIESDLEETVVAPSRHSPRRLRNTTKQIRITGSRPEIRTEHLLSVNVKLYRHENPLAALDIKMHAMD